MASSIRPGWDCLEQRLTPKDMLPTLGGHTMCIMRISDDHTIVNISVVHGVDRNGKFTVDPVELVEGELRLTYPDGSSKTVGVFRQIEWLPAIMPA